ncbi:MAG TPA: 4Fe-4S binding protein [Acidobacteriota bacterium]|nr:4Fe-4S binding protein [Acidobacteriota bacterium]
MRNGFDVIGRRFAGWFILAASVLFPALAVRLLTPSPRIRSIHIEAFRYGFSPSRIKVNRGDRLRLTFSTRDTGQSFFLQDYDVHVVITPGSNIVEVHRLSQPDAPPSRQSTVELTAGLPGFWGLFVAKSQFRNHTYNGPLHGTERGDLIVAPNYLLAGSLGLLAVLPLLLLLRRNALAELKPRTANLFTLLPWLKKLMKKPSFQFDLTIPMLAVFYFVILAGLLGTKVSGRNAGPMVIWVLWLSALIIFLVPLGGRIWCLVCPLPSLGEWLQRRRLVKITSRTGDTSPRRILGFPLVWPDRLRNAWPSLLFFLLLGTFSTAIVALPPVSSWLLIGLVAMAALISVFPEQRLFCRHLCPINAFISLYSTTGRLTARSVSSDTCLHCTERFCLTGSAKGWGCPYGLCMGEVKDNYACGMCTECIKSCAYDNVAFFLRSSGWDRNLPGFAAAWQAIVMFALSIIYCVVNLGAWHRIRDWIDIVDKQNWNTFAVYAVTVWTVCLGVLPLLLYLLTRVGVLIAGSGLQPAMLFRACSAALIPLGLSGWIAFALATLLSMMTFVLQSLSDPFNWGWDLLGTAGSRWHIIWAPAIPWLQAACVLVGVLHSLRTLYLCWQDAVPNRRSAMLGSLPLASSLWLAGAAMIWFFAG